MMVSLVAACPVTLPEDQSVRYRCASDADCVDGQLCRAGRCVAMTTDAALLGDGAVDGAERDASAIDVVTTVDAAAATDSAGSDRTAPTDAAPATDSAVAVDAAATDSAPAADTAQWVDAAQQIDAVQQVDAAPQVDAALPIDAGQPVLYGNDFSTGTLTGLTTGEGTWTSSSGVLQQTESCSSATDVAVDDGNWTDFRASVRVRFDDPCDNSGLRQAALLIRVVDVSGCNNRYYGCLIDVDSDFLMVADWNYQCITYDNVWTSTSPQTTGVWYTITAIMQGSTLTCTVSGGDLTQDYTRARTDSSTIIAAGSVGLATWAAAVSFDDLVVEAL